jgi:hypothetical protein
MLAAVCGGVFLKSRESLFQSGRKFGINRDFAQRRFPGPFARNGQSPAYPSVVWTQKDAAPWNLHARKDRARHVPGIHVAGVRSDAPHSSNRSLIYEEGL